MIANVTPLASVRVDFNFSDPCYVLQLVASDPARGGDAAVVAALSNHALKLFACGAGDLRHVADMTGHNGRITDVCMPRGAPSELAISSSEDGTVRCWDLRSQAECERFESDGAELASCCSAQHVVAAGAEGRVVFWDRRTRQQLAELSDTHMEVVTALRFNPAHQNAFVSASEDGLVAMFDFSGGINEDDAFRAALNINTTPAALGFYGPSAGRLWCTSATETLHTWDWADAAAEPEADFEDLAAEAPSATPAEMQHVLDARERLTSVAKAHAAQLGQMDYLVGCHEVAGRLHVCGGSNSGALASFPVASSAAGGHFGAPAAVLRGAHTEPVRSVVCVGSVMLTGGEDSRVVVWGDADALERELEGSPGDGGGSAVRAGMASQDRHSPY